ncbi:uncharacterized protein LOC132610350 isoform X2 [Lycium barbarum]|uniref:uncharacterized protein LOC132610350 isoform X2 n=1 Tax=Lycium barbarum TaxID=112863 RepID=UPI00293E93E5|nr:uncharacterized protein LOC132610350 isoform X2 [Lycium barbarum]
MEKSQSKCEMHSFSGVIYGQRINSKAIFTYIFPKSVMILVHNSGALARYYDNTGLGVEVVWRDRCLPFPHVQPCLGFMKPLGSCAASGIRVVITFSLGMTMAIWAEVQIPY